MLSNYITETSTLCYCLRHSHHPPHPQMKILCIILKGAYFYLPFQIQIPEYITKENNIKVRNACLVNYQHNKSNEVYHDLQIQTGCWKNWHGQPQLD